MPIFRSARIQLNLDNTPVKEKSKVPCMRKPRQPSSLSSADNGVSSVLQTSEISSSVLPIKKISRVGSISVMNFTLQIVKS